MSGVLPEPVARWLAATPTSHASQTAALEGRARFRREGRGLWLPIEAVMWHELGRHHVADLRVGLGPLTVVRVMDGFVDDAGFSRVAHTLDLGPEVDPAAALFMWAAAILFPPAWETRDDVEWSSIDATTADLALPQGGERIPARMDFDPDSGYPSRFSAERHKGVGTRPVEWIVDYGDWKTTSDGVLLPGLATVTWSDEPGPWFRMWIERANPGCDVAGALSRGRALLEQAAADPTR